MKKSYLENKGKRPLYKSLIWFLTAWLSVAISYAQSPQWIMAQPVVPNSAKQVLLNYFVSEAEQGDPYHINRTSPQYSSQVNGPPLDFSKIYGSYVYRQDNIGFGVYYANNQTPQFIIAKENNAPSTDIKIWKTQNSFNATTQPFSFRTMTGTASQPLFNGQDDRPLIYANDEPEFTIIPRIGFNDQYLAFTYIRVGANGANGKLLCYIIQNNGKFWGPYYPYSNGVSIDSTMASSWGPKGTIAISKPTAGSSKQKLFVAVEGHGIFKFTIDHFDQNGQILNNTNSGGTGYYPGKICRPTNGLGTSTVAAGSTFKTSELELSPDGNLIAWGDDNSDAGGNNMATVYTINPNTSTGTLNVIPISNNLFEQKVNGIEFNPNYNPAAGINTQLYVTAGSNNASLNKDDGLFKISVPASGVASVSPIRHLFNVPSIPCAQSQLEIDYNKALAMIYADGSTQQFRNYLPESLTHPNGEWKYLERYTAETLYPGYEIHRLPRQVDYWDYKFGGTIHGQNQPLVTNGGCSPGTPQTSFTYSAPIINSINPWDITYLWELKDLDNPSIPTVTGTNSTFQINFTTTPYRNYELKLKVIIYEQYVNSPSTYAYRYDTRMAIRTTNGCPPPSNNRVAQLEGAISKTILYPNPVINKQLSVKLPEGYEQAQVEITDLQGRTVQKNNVLKNEETLNLSRLNPGVYLINIITPDFTKKEKIVIAN